MGKRGKKEADWMDVKGEKLSSFTLYVVLLFFFLFLLDLLGYFFA
jgi:hypothetical protein